MSDSNRTKTGVNSDASARDKQFRPMFATRRVSDKRHGHHMI